VLLLRLLLLPLPGLPLLLLLLPEIAMPLHPLVNGTPKAITAARKNGEHHNQVVKRKTPAAKRMTTTTMRMKTETGLMDDFLGVDESVPTMMKPSPLFMSMVEVRARVTPVENKLQGPHQHHLARRLGKTAFILDVQFGVGAARIPVPPIAFRVIRIEAEGLGEIPFILDVPWCAMAVEEMMEHQSYHDSPFNPSHLPSSLYQEKLNSWMMKTMMMWMTKTQRMITPFLTIPIESLMMMLDPLDHVRQQVGRLAEALCR